MADIKQFDPQLLANGYINRVNNKGNGSLKYMVLKNSVKSGIPKRDQRKSMKASLQYRFASK